MAFSEKQWEEARIDYEINNKSLNQVSKEHGISFGAVQKRSKKENWVQGKSDTVITESVKAITTLEQQKVIKSDNFTPREAVEIDRVIEERVRIEHRLQSITHKIFDKVETMVEMVEMPNDLKTLQDTLKSGRETVLGKDPSVVNNNTNAQQNITEEKIMEAVARSLPD